MVTPYFVFSSLSYSILLKKPNSVRSFFNDSFCIGRKYLSKAVAAWPAIYAYEVHDVFTRNS